MVRHGLSRPRRLAVAAAVGVMATLACQPLAFAHVSVSPDTAEPGEPSMLSFGVPNERDDATTTRLEVTFPADHPLSSVTPQSMPGWQITVHKEPMDKPAGAGDEMDNQTVSSIVWEGGSIPADTFTNFTVRIGKMPDTGQLSFKALQTYSDGQVVRWIDLMQPGQPEPEHPAPTVTIAKAAAPAESTSDSDPVARILGGVGIAAGVAAAGVAFTRRRAAPVDQAVPEREKARL
ncbi:DUF1775 domain-containing protein [Amycolatopsis sp. RM579]|uniref:DUF1775 domain-containing protein n=2 Tax=Amycolatopsis pithecellobii TaxID=664692 RepID=A0A6N7YWP6_9PSEU|nr:DUF1775 domain-containing protein [Amycolatopsis pithecellobii]